MPAPLADRIRNLARTAPHRRRGGLKLSEASRMRRQERRSVKVTAARARALASRLNIAMTKVGGKINRVTDLRERMDVVSPVLQRAVGQSVWGTVKSAFFGGPEPRRRAWTTRRKKYGPSGAKKRTAKPFRHGKKTR